MIVPIATAADIVLHIFRSECSVAYITLHFTLFRDTVQIVRHKDLGFSGEFRTVNEALSKLGLISIAGLVSSRNLLRLRLPADATVLSLCILEFLSLFPDLVE